MAQILLLGKEMSWIEVNLPFDAAAEKASNVTSLVPRSYPKPMKLKAERFPEAPRALRPALPQCEAGTEGNPDSSRCPSKCQLEALLPFKLRSWKTDKKQNISLN